MVTAGSDAMDVADICPAKHLVAFELGQLVLDLRLACGAAQLVDLLADGVAVDRREGADRQLRVTLLDQHDVLVDGRFEPDAFRRCDVDQLAVVGHRAIERPVQGLQ